MGGPRNSLSRSVQLSGPTCSLSPLWDFCGVVLLPVLPLELTLALDRLLFLFTWWEVFLTTLWELHTEMPLSAVEPHSRGRNDGEIGECLQSHYHKTWHQWLYFSTNPFIIFILFLRYTLDKNAVENVEVRLLPQALYWERLPGLFQSTYSVRVSQSSVGMEADCCGFYHCRGGNDPQDLWLCWNQHDI